MTLRVLGLLTGLALAAPVAKHLNFTDDEVIETGVTAPDGTVVGSRLPTKHDSLIKVRTNFKAEMIRSAENL